MTTITREIDCINQNCPMPLILTREAVMNAEEGDTIKITGTHPQSFEEIPMALEAMEIPVVEKKMEEKSWYIIFTV